MLSLRHRYLLAYESFNGYVQALLSPWLSGISIIPTLLGELRSAVSCDALIMLPKRLNLCT